MLVEVHIRSDLYVYDKFEVEELEGTCIFVHGIVAVLWYKPHLNTKKGPKVNLWSLFYPFQVGIIERVSSKETNGY